MILTHGANSINRSGGGQPYYYTLYQNFDFVTKIDYPIIGEPTQYDATNNYTYNNDLLVYDGEEINALNLKNSSSTTQNNLIPLQLNSFVEFVCKINMSNSSSPVFIWTEDGFGFFVDMNKGNFIGIISPQDASNYEVKNGARPYNVSYGAHWFLTPLANNAVFKFKIDYSSEKIICSVNGVEYVVFYVTNIADKNLKIDARMNNNLSITDIKCYLK